VDLGVIDQLSMYLSIIVSIALQPLWTLAVFLVSLSYTQTVGLLGISPSQGRYLHTEQTHTEIHASSGIRTHDPSFQGGKTIHGLHRAATVIGDRSEPIINSVLR
jgi:hypothetical protein